MDERQRYEQGMKVRCGVPYWGDAHVDASLKNRNEFNDAFQDLLTRYLGKSLEPPRPSPADAQHDHVGDGGGAESD